METIDIGNKLFVVIVIGTLTGLQLGAWYMGFNGQLTLILTSTIVGLVMLVTGLKIDLKK